jgi:S-adenosylmethionine hydrolase
MKGPLITLLTDFGLADHFAGAMKGVILGICPTAQIIDISHEVAPYAVTEAGFTLAQAWRCFPEGTMHVVVVDPGVGSARRPILVEADKHYFVAPDNGVLTMLYDEAAKHEVREITASRYFRQPMSRTFHGRDLFAPVAAHWATGVGMTEFGDLIHDYVRLPFSRPVRTEEGCWLGTILKVDRFGNVITNFVSEEWQRFFGQRFAMTVGERVVSRSGSNYADMPRDSLFVIAGSAGYLEVSLNQGNAARAAGVKAGDPVEIRVV